MDVTRSEEGFEEAEGWEAAIQDAVGTCVADTERVHAGVPDMQACESDRSIEAELES